MNRLTRKEHRQKRHCDSECPRCGVHADPEDSAAPKLHSMTTAGEVAFDTWNKDGRAAIEVNFACPSCQIMWSGIVEMESDE